MQPTIATLVHDQNHSSGHRHMSNVEYAYPPSPAISQYSATRSNSDVSCCADVHSSCSCDGRSMRLPSISSLLADCPIQEMTPRQSPKMLAPLTTSQMSSYPSSQPKPYGSNHRSGDYAFTSNNRPLYSPRSSPPSSYLIPPPNFYGATNTAIIERYPCDCCNKSFSRPSSLRIHKHSHTGERPFVCSIPGCERAFSVRSNMRRHMKVHQSD